MAYDPADLKLPPWLLALFDLLVRIRLPVAPGWRFGVTRPGIIYLGALFGVVGAALYSGNNLLYLCAAMLFVLAASALVQGGKLLFDLPPLAVAVPTFATVHSVTVVHEPLASSLPFAAGITVTWPDGCQMLLRNSENGSELLGRLSPRPRGIYRFDDCWLLTEAPLGLWRLERHRRDALTLVLLPEQVAWRGAAIGSEGSRNSAQTPGDEWHDLRSYVPGDSPARIHWRKQTEFGSWVVKRFGQPEGGEALKLLRVDLRCQPGNRFERLLGMVVSWIEEQPGSVLILGQERFELARPASREAALRAIAAATPTTTPPAGEGGVLLVMR